MIKALEPMANEIQQEAAVTRRVLERIPEEKLSWKPHPKSMSLGQLALHVANIPGGISRIAQLDGFDASQANFDPAPPNNVDEIFTAFDASLKAAEEYLCGLSESAVSHQLRLLRDQRLVRPRRAGQMIFYALDDHHIVKLFAQGLEHVQERALAGRG